MEKHIKMVYDLKRFAIPKLSCNLDCPTKCFLKWPQCRKVEGFQMITKTWSSFKVNSIRRVYKMSSWRKAVFAFSSVLAEKCRRFPAQMTACGLKSRVNSGHSVHECLEGSFLPCDQLQCSRVIVNMERGRPETPTNQRLLCVICAWMRLL